MRGVGLLARLSRLKPRVQGTVYSNNHLISIPHKIGCAPSAPWCLWQAGRHKQVGYEAPMISESIITSCSPCELKVHTPSLPLPSPHFNPDDSVRQKVSRPEVVSQRSCTSMSSDSPEARRGGAGRRSSRGYRRAARPSHRFGPLAAR